MAFELVVHDATEEPPTYVPLSRWGGRFALHGVGVRLDDGRNQLLSERFGTLRDTAAGCRVAAARLSEGKVALLRTSTDNPAAYLVFSAEDPVRVTWTDGPSSGAYPYPRTDTSPEAVAELLSWAETGIEQLLAPSGRSAFDEARGLALRLPRAELVRELLVQAELAEAAQ